MDRLKSLIRKEQEYNLLLEKTKEYGFDSLCLRYEKARNAQMESEIKEDKRRTGGIKEEHIRSMADRDKMRFYTILRELLGEGVEYNGSK